MPLRPGKIRNAQRKNKKVNDGIVKSIDSPQPKRKPLTQAQKDAWKRQHFNKDGTPKTRVSRQ